MVAAAWAFFRAGFWLVSSLGLVLALSTSWAGWLAGTYTHLVVVLRLMKD